MDHSSGLFIRSRLRAGNSGPGESRFWSWPRHTNVPGAMLNPSLELSQLLDRVNSPMRRA